MVREVAFSAVDPNRHLRGADACVSGAALMTGGEIDARWAAGVGPIVRVHEQECAVRRFDRLRIVSLRLHCHFSGWMIRTDGGGSNRVDDTRSRGPNPKATLPARWVLGAVVVAAAQVLRRTTPSWRIRTSEKSELYICQSEEFSPSCRIVPHQLLRFGFCRRPASGGAGSTSSDAQLRPV
eukprot:COSAG02_NODE_12080_length_1601_cov_2.647803_2_plen_181_part_00